MSDRPEQHVIDEIDELIAAGLDDNGQPLDDYSADRYVKCELCHNDWHGLTSPFGCPGESATEEQRKEWAEKSMGKGEYVGYMETGDYRIDMWRDEDGQVCGHLGMPSESEDSERAGFSSDLMLIDEPLVLMDEPSQLMRYMLRWQPVYCSPLQDNSRFTLRGDSS